MKKLSWVVAVDGASKTRSDSEKEVVLLSPFKIKYRSVRGPISLGVRNTD